MIIAPLLLSVPVCLIIRLIATAFWWITSAKQTRSLQNQPVNNLHLAEKPWLTVCPVPHCCHQRMWQWSSWVVQLTHRDNYPWPVLCPSALCQSSENFHVMKPRLTRPFVSFCFHKKDLHKKPNHLLATAGVLPWAVLAPCIESLWKLNWHSQSSLGQIPRSAIQPVLNHRITES